MNFGALPTVFFRDKARNVDLRYERTLSAGTASAASLAPLSPGSSARAIPAGVAALRSHHQCFLLKE